MCYTGKCNKTAKAESDPLPKKRVPSGNKMEALFAKRKELLLVLCDLLGTSNTFLGRRGGLSPLNSSCVAGGMGRQAGLFPHSQARQEAWESFSLPWAGSSKGWAACKLPLGLSFWLESKAN